MAIHNTTNVGTDFSGAGTSSDCATFDRDAVNRSSNWYYLGDLYGLPDERNWCPQRVGEEPAVQHDPPRVGDDRMTWQPAQSGAEERAEELLRLFLTEDQLVELEEHDWFTVQGRQRSYRIRRGRTGNVQELDEQGRVVARWCIHPTDPIPDADTMLAQKLMIEADEAEFVEIGNRSPRR